MYRAGSRCRTFSVSHRCNRLVGWRAETSRVDGFARYSGIDLRPRGAARLASEARRPHLIVGGAAGGRGSVGAGGARGTGGAGPMEGGGPGGTDRTAGGAGPTAGGGITGSPT